LVRNEYGSKLFADFFSLSLISRISRFLWSNHKYYLFNVLVGTYEKRKSYEMVEKVGLGIVDLVWVFVFTVFYLV
jgi:cytochrome c oxidase subunit 3